MSLCERDEATEITNHTSLDGVKRVGQITGKEASQQGCWNPSSVIVGEGAGVAFCGRKCRRCFDNDIIKKANVRDGRVGMVTNNGAGIVGTLL